MLNRAFEAIVVAAEDTVVVCFIVKGFGFQIWRAAFLIFEFSALTISEGTCTNKLKLKLRLLSEFRYSMSPE